MRHLSKHLRIYINYCSKCELNQIKRYKSYENIIFINKSEIPFHIIVMNFIITFFIIKNGIDNLLIMINKFSKRILLIFERVTYNVNK